MLQSGGGRHLGFVFAICWSPLKTSALNFVRRYWPYKGYGGSVSHFLVKFGHNLIIEDIDVKFGAWTDSGYHKTTWGAMSHFW